jgi:hypothetical protein
MKGNFMYRILVVTGALLALAGAAQAQNLFTNGDFSGGNVGFTSAYTFNATNLVGAGTYSVGTNPGPFNSPNWTSYGDHTSGTGNMMVVNGADVPGVSVWSQTVSGLTPNTDYFFSTWVASILSANPAELQFSVNGNPFGSIFTASPIEGQWNQWTATWNSGSSTSATFSLLNQNTNFFGNDFTLDDFSLTTQDPGGTNISAPEPGTLALFAMPLLGFLKRRRK